MAPIERELRAIDVARLNWSRVSTEAFHVCCCASVSLFGESMCVYWDDRVPDVLSEAAEALGI